LVRHKQEQGLQTMNQLKTYILRQVAAQQLGQDEARSLLLELAQNQTPTPTPAADVSSDKKIAIIGMAGRFPQADNAEAFWQQLRDGLNCIVDYPLNRRKDIEAIMRNPYYLEYLTGNAITLKDLDQVFAPAGYMQEVDSLTLLFLASRLMKPLIWTRISAWHWKWLGRRWKTLVMVVRRYMALTPAFILAVKAPTWRFIALTAKKIRCS